MTTPTPTSSFPETVCIESPFRNPLPEVPLIGELYRDYLHDCLRDSLSRGEAPFAGHAYLTQVLGDEDEAERRQGIDCHLAWLSRAEGVAVYLDFGVSTGMQEAMSSRVGEWRSLEAWRYLGGYVRGFIYGWRYGDDGPDVGIIDAPYNRGMTDGARRDPALFRP